MDRMLSLRVYYDCMSDYSDHGEARREINLRVSQVEINVQTLYKYSNQKVKRCNLDTLIEGWNGSMHWRRENLPYGNAHPECFGLWFMNCNQLCIIRSVKCYQTNNLISVALLVSSAVSSHLMSVLKTPKTSKPTKFDLALLSQPALHKLLRLLSGLKDSFRLMQLS